MLADVETEDISQYFNESYNFIEEAKTAREGMPLCILINPGRGIPTTEASHAMFA